jgi:GT2 family glycosyltransferase
MPKNAEAPLSVAVIIPFQRYNDYVDETLTALENLEQKPKNLQVVLLPDAPFSEQVNDSLKKRQLTIVVVSTGPVSPAIKRDRGAEITQSDVIALIDDDAYPKPDWLIQALPHFQNQEVTAVGGPQVTPPHDDFWQQVSGATFLSILNGGAMRSRYWPIASAPREVDDWPSVNLLIRRTDFLAVGGFDSAYWPGEDTKLCLDLTQKLKKKMIYEPHAIVFHHRRAGLKRHLKQIGNYGLHRGFFAKTLPETSLRPIYFVPSLFTLFALSFVLFEGLHLGNLLPPR